MVLLEARWSVSPQSLPLWQLSPTQFLTPQASALKYFPSHRIKSFGRSKPEEDRNMKSFENIDAKSIKEAVSLLQKFQQQKKSAAVVGGGSEYLQLMKDRVVTPDYVINLKTISGLNYIREERGGFRIGALATLAELEEHTAVKEKLLILSEAAGEAASPQIRNAGTIAGNLCQRPFCWYFRSSNFNCLRKGGEVCYTVPGHSRFHASRGPGLAAFTQASVADRATSYNRRILRQRWLPSTHRSRSLARQAKKPSRLKSSLSCRRWTLNAKISSNRMRSLPRFMFPIRRLAARAFITRSVNGWLGITPS